MARKPHINITTENYKLIQEWGKSHNVPEQEIIDLISGVIGYPFTIHKDYSKIKNALKKNTPVAKIADKLNVSSCTINKIINMYDDLKMMYVDKIGVDPKVNFTKKQKLLLNLQQYGVKTSLASHYIPKNIFHALSYNKLIEIGLESKLIDKYYKNLGIECTDKDVPPRELMRVNFVSDIVKQLFYAKTYKEITAKYNVPYHILDSVVKFYPQLAVYRQELRHKIAIHGKYMTHETTVPLRNLMMALHKRCKPCMFRDIPSTMTIPSVLLTHRNHIPIATNTGNVVINKNVDSGYDEAKKGRREELSIPLVDIEVYYMIRDGVPMDFILKKFNITLAKANEIYAVQKEIMEGPETKDKEYDEETVINMYVKQYKTMDDITEEIGIDATKIRSILRANKISLRSPNIEQVNRRDVLDKFKDGLSLSEIAEEYGIQIRTIRNIIEAQIGPMHNKSNSMTYIPKMELCNWNEFEIGILESSMTDYEVSTLLNLPQSLIKNKRIELEEKNAD